VSGEREKSSAQAAKGCAVIRLPVRELALSEVHKLGREQESIRSGKDDRCCHCVLDACHDHCRGHSDQVLYVFRKLNAVLEAGCGDALVGEQPGVQDKTIQAILRHATLGVMQNLYIKAVNADSVTAMQSLESSVESVLCAKRAPGAAISPSRAVN
jgi:hypothetical protein